MPDAIRKWQNVLKGCQHIVDQFPASIVAKYTSGNIFTISWHIVFVADVLPFWAVSDAIRRWENILKHCQCVSDNFPASIGAKYTSGSNFTISWPILFVADLLPFWAVPDAIRRWENILKHCRCILDNFPASLSSNYISGNNFTISWPITFMADVLPFWTVPDAIRKWKNVLKECRRILDQFPASIGARYTSGSNVTISWPIVFVAVVLPFWAVRDAIRRWENGLEDCRCILDQFPASLSSNYISGNNFTISWPIVFVADVLPFWAVPGAIRRWENILKHCRHISDNFPGGIGAKYIPAAISQFLDPLFLWPMYCHFGPCRTQSGSGKTFWYTADAFWINFRQALVQNTLPAAISWFLDALFLWLMYCHFGPCRTQSGGGKTFWNTADAFWIIFRQAYLQIIFPATISQFLDPLFCGRCIAILGRAGRNPEVGKHSETLPTHFG